MQAQLLDFKKRGDDCLQDIGFQVDICQLEGAYARKVQFQSGYVCSRVLVPEAVPYVIKY